MVQSMSPTAAGAKEDFVERFPDYGDRGLLDDLRLREFSRLDRLGHVYLDFTGSGLHAESQIRGPAELLLGYGDCGQSP